MPSASPSSPSMERLPVAHRQPPASISITASENVHTLPHSTQTHRPRLEPFGLRAVFSSASSFLHFIQPLDHSQSCLGPAVLSSLFGSDPWLRARPFPLYQSFSPNEVSGSPICLGRESRWPLDTAERASLRLQNICSSLCCLQR